MSEFEGWTTWLEPAFLLWKPSDSGYDPDKAIFSPEEEAAIMDEQIHKSDGFGIDFSLFRCVFNYHRAYLDSDEFVDEPETTEDLLNRLSQNSLQDYNQKHETVFEFVKVVKANFHVAAGIMFLITFEVKDPYDGRVKLFRARVRHCKDMFTEYVFCRPKPDEEEECVGTAEKDVQKDVKKQKI